MHLPLAFRFLGRALGALSFATLPALSAAAIPFTLGAPQALAQSPDDGEEDDGVDELFQQAMTQLQEKDYEGALKTYARLEKIVEASSAPAEAKAQLLQLAHYNSACALSLQGKRQQALDRFEKALAAGFLDFDHMAKDTDLDPIRDEERYQALLEKYQGKKAADDTAKVDGAKAGFLKNISSDALFPFDFDVKDVEGVTLRLADMRGKVVLVNVWGTWCPPCRKEVPHLAELHTKLGPKGFAVVGLACERVPAAEAPAVVKKFLADNKVPYPSAVIDSKFPSKNIPDFEGFPTLLLVDRHGRVRMKVVGYTEAALLEAAAEKLLAEEGPTAATPTPATPETPATPAGEGGARKEF